MYIYMWITGGITHLLSRMPKLVEKTRIIADSRDDPTIEVVSKRYLSW